MKEKIKITPTPCNSNLKNTLSAQKPRHSDLDFLGGIIPPALLSICVFIRYAHKRKRLRRPLGRKPPCRQFFVNKVYKKLQNLWFPKGVSPFGGEFERQSLSNRNDVAQNIERRQHCVQGQVQGVGFRPFVYRLAHAHALSGFVHNTPDGVFIEVQGAIKDLCTFEERFNVELPPLARISSHTIVQIPLIEQEATELEVIDEKESAHNITQENKDIEYIKNVSHAHFYIKHTKNGAHEGHTVLISPDCATCPDCAHDLDDPNSLHYAYPFTNCTNCGPRYTITKSIPYDRVYTSMACFPMCPDCQKEYDNPMDRRFHAQPNACEVCGPRLWLVKNNSISDQNLGDMGSQKGDTSFFGGARRQSHPNLNDVSSKYSMPEIVQSSQSVIEQTRKLLKSGNIIAIKALGGFQLACDAYNAEAINLLRQRKNRPHKAFAIMVANMDEARRVAHITKEAEALLTSKEAPIVLCPKRDVSEFSSSVAPDTNRIGIMLAYTPLHKMLFQTSASKQADTTKQVGVKAQGLRALIMTSANTSGEPICIQNRQALQNLSHITDYYLFHNRDILVRVDDSVCLALHEKKMKKGDGVKSVVTQGSLAQRQYVNAESSAESNTEEKAKSKLDTNKLPAILFFRRARGYVPSPTVFPKIVQTLLESKDSKKNDTKNTLPSVFATGAFLKNTFCITRNTEAFVSQHMGDLENLATMEFYEETYAHLKKLLEIHDFKSVVCDAHPDFPSTHFGHKIAQEYNAPLYVLQHHFAHAYAVLAEQENYDLSPTLALVLDGTGYGLDGTSWGAELLYLAPHPNYNAVNNMMIRLGRLSPMPLIGGEVAILEPWRIAYGLYLECVKKEYLQLLDFDLLPWHTDSSCKELAPMLKMMLEKDINCPKTSGCGRLFDAISALLGLCLFSSYEGQAAIKLEAEQFVQKQVSESIKNNLNILIVENKEELAIKVAYIQSIMSHSFEGVQNSAYTGGKQSKNSGFPKGVIPFGGEFERQSLSNRNNINHSNTQKINTHTPIWEVDSHAIFAEAFNALSTHITKAEISQNFHTNLAFSFSQMAIQAKEKFEAKNIVLCGGVMNNETLLTCLYEALCQAGFNVLLPKNMPSGDGAISLGQAFYGVLRS